MVQAHHHEGRQAACLNQLSSSLCHTPAVARQGLAVTKHVLAVVAVKHWVGVLLALFLAVACSKEHIAHQQTKRLSMVFEQLC
jgi:hypothetical protein